MLFITGYKGPSTTNTFSKLILVAQVCCPCIIMSWHLLKRAVAKIKMYILYVTNTNSLCLQLLVFCMQFMQGCPMYKEYLLQTPAISHRQNIGTEAYCLDMPVPGTCQQYGKFWHYQKYRTVADKIPMNWNLNVCTSFKQTTDGERGSGLASVVLFKRIFQPTEKKLKLWQTRIKHFLYLCYLQLTSHQTSNFLIYYFIASYPISL